MTDKDLKIIQKKIGYNFRNPDLLHQAFIRKSYALENGIEDNEVMEFIGDKALDAVIVKILIEKYGNVHDSKGFNSFSCTYSEGALTDIKSRLVQKSTLAHRIDDLGFTKYLIMNVGDKKNKVNNQKSVKEDLFEAIIGAAAIDCNWDINTLQSLITNMLDPDAYLSSDDKENYFEHICEWHLKKHNEYPRITISANEKAIKTNTSSVFCYIPQKDTYDAKDTVYCCTLKLGGIRNKFTAYDRSKSAARKNACKIAYNYLKERNMLISIKDEIRKPNKADAINQLEILSRRGYFALPTYSYIQGKNESNNSVWECSCNLADYPVFKSSATSKKDAKKDTAYQMLMHILTCGE